MRSRDRLVFLRHRVTPTDKPRWILAQIDLDATNPRLAKTMGTYVARRYAPHHTDQRNKPYTHCRFWPDVRTRTHPDDPRFEPLYVSPGKVQRALQHNPLAVWPEENVNLGTNLLVGPFNFLTDPNSPPTRDANRGARFKTNKFTQTIDLELWDNLRTIGQQRGVDTSDIDVIPNHHQQTSTLPPR
jgi:hypothetical protein